MLAALLARSGAFGRRGDDTRLQEEIGTLGERLETLADRIEVAGTRPRTVDGGLGEAIGSTIKLDEVLRRTLAAAGALPGVDGSEIVVPGPGGWAAREVMGAIPPEIVATPVGPPDGRPFRSAMTRYDYPDRAGGALRSALAVPVGSHPNSVLAVYSRLAEAFDAEALETLEAVAGRAAPAIANAIEYLEVEQLTVTDSLTGLVNRRGYDQALEREVAIARRTGRPLALMIIDLDHFRQVNTEFELPGGDAVLAAFADCMRSAVRVTDIACRRGGEEFAVVLPETTCDQARAAYERLRLTAAATTFPFVGTMTFSAGIGDLRPGDSAEALDGRASAAEGRSKTAGRNRLTLDCLDLLA